QALSDPVRQAWASATLARRGARSAPYRRVQPSHDVGRAAHPTSVGSPMANHADCGRIARVPAQTLPPDSALVARGQPLSTTRYANGGAQTAVRIKDHRASSHNGTIGRDHGRQRTRVQEVSD